MSERGFWVRCADIGCVIVPVIVYSQYSEDGNLDDQYRVGVRFMPLMGNDLDVVQPDCWMMVDECVNAKRNGIYDTPEDALSAAEDRHAAVMRRLAKNSRP